MRSVKATIMTMQTIRTIRNGHISNREPGVRREIDLVRTLGGEAA